MKYAKSDKSKINRTSNLPNCFKSYISKCAIV